VSAQRIRFRGYVHTLGHLLPNVLLVLADGGVGIGDHPLNQGQVVLMSGQGIRFDLHRVST
jgi:hypothetical protein